VNIVIVIIIPRRNLKYLRNAKCKSLLGGECIWRKKRKRVERSQIKKKKKGKKASNPRDGGSE
jgi:hypothetical protein